MQKETIYSNLYHELLAFDPAIIYVAIGCVMGGEPTPDVNQQNPMFMEKYAGQKKFYIFFDPRMETPLTLEAQIKLDTKYEKDLKSWYNNLVYYKSYKELIGTKNISHSAINNYSEKYSFMFITRVDIYIKKDYYPI
jgi:hypothetical protein